MNDYDENWEQFDLALTSFNLKDAEINAHKLDDNWLIAESLGKVAKAYFPNGDVTKAKTLLLEAVNIPKDGEMEVNPQNSIDSSSVLWELAESLALMGEIEKAEDVAKSIKNEWKRKRALDGLVQISEGKSGSF